MHTYHRAQSHSVLMGEYNSKQISNLVNITQKDGHANLQDIINVKLNMLSSVKSGFD